MRFPSITDSEIIHSEEVGRHAESVILSQIGFLSIELLDKMFFSSVQDHIQIFSKGRNNVKISSEKSTDLISWKTHRAERQRAEKLTEMKLVVVHTARRYP